MNTRHDISIQGLSESLTDNHGNRPSAYDLVKTEAALLSFVALHTTKPPLSMRGKILDNLQKLQKLKENRQPFTLENLPLLTSDSNWLDWEAAVAGIEPAHDFEDIHLHLLEDNDQRELHILWVKQEVPEEVHHDVLESFTLLDGSCECHISNEKGEVRIVKMYAGDHIAFKLGETHDVYVTSATPAKAILQWLKLAA